MEYALAKQLKDAGFPQDYENRIWHFTEVAGHEPHERAWGRMFSAPNNIEVEDPTLSKLIKACGMPRFKLCASGNAYWWATADWKDDMKYFEGATPEEAVARLWLALNNGGGGKPADAT